MARNASVSGFIEVRGDQASVDKNSNEDAQLISLSISVVAMHHQIGP